MSVFFAFSHQRWGGITRADKYKMLSDKLNTQGISGLVVSCVSWRTSGVSDWCYLVMGGNKSMNLAEIQKIQVNQCPAFSDFAKDKLPMPGDKKRLGEILNKEILVTDFRVTQSKQRDGEKCLQIQFVMNSNVYVLFTGSSVLIDQIQSAKDKIPFKTSVVKVDRYFSFS